MNIQEFNELTNNGKIEVLQEVTGIIWVKRLIWAALLFTILIMGGCPMYNVWEQGLTGEAALARATQDWQILIEEALAKKESSVHWAAAEVERAKGAAQANQIVAESLGGPEGYLRWLFIEKLDEIKSGQIIYLPTEAGIPILEAGRLK